MIAKIFQTLLHTGTVFQVSSVVILMILLPHFITDNLWPLFTGLASYLSAWKKVTSPNLEFALSLLTIGIAKITLDIWETGAKRGWNKEEISNQGNVG